MKLLQQLLSAPPATIFYQPGEGDDNVVITINDETATVPFEELEAAMDGVETKASDYYNPHERHLEIVAASQKVVEDELPNGVEGYDALLKWERVNKLRQMAKIVSAKTDCRMSSARDNIRKVLAAERHRLKMEAGDD